MFIHSPQMFFGPLQQYFQRFCACIRFCLCLTFLEEKTKQNTQQKLFLSFCSYGMLLFPLTRPVHSSSAEDPLLLLLRLSVVRSSHRQSPVCCSAGRDHSQLQQGLDCCWSTTPRFRTGGRGSARGSWDEQLLQLQRLYVLINADILYYYYYYYSLLYFWI